MPTSDRSRAVSLEDALDLIERTAFPDTSASEPSRKLGLEPERFVIRVGKDDLPAGRLPLFGEGGVVETLDANQARSKVMRPRDPQRVPPFVELDNGGSLTFEPGAQIEHSTAVHATANEALADVRTVVCELATMFRERSVALLSVGLDPFDEPESVPQQLEHGRYHAMAAYLAKIGPSGAAMMRGSTSLQVNVDLGSGPTREDRYRLANLLSPSLVASFSTSPERPGAKRFHCRRARVWQTLDPSRTGFPKSFSDSQAPTASHCYAEAMLDADVLLFLGNDPKGADAAVGTPGFRFRDWMRDGHPEHGFPTPSDLAYHLTTVFPEVRARGFLELRAIDGLPDCWRAGAVAFVAGLIYDDRALGLALELLEPWRQDLQARWWSSAERGFEDDELAEVTQKLWTIALDGAERLGEDYLAREELDQAIAYRDRFPERRRAPADELRETLTRCPGEGLLFASDPAQECGSNASLTGRA